jgi:HD-GYP domain-containing protein (c-di-GMP phosphodiesterase class II)
MTALANENSPKRRLLLASDRSDQSSELAGILQSVGEVDTIMTADIPETPAGDCSGIVVDINLRSPESVQLVRNKLSAEAYRNMPRLFVLADALHHGSMQAWALGATDTIARPFDARGILQRIRAAFPDSGSFDATESGKTLNTGVAAAHAVMVKIFEKLPAGGRLTFDDVVEAENKILKAIKHSSLRAWLTTVGCHHAATYRHCLFVTGFAVAFAQHLGMREDDQRRLTRAALLHDVGRRSSRLRSWTSRPRSPMQRWRWCASIRVAATTRWSRKAASRRKCWTWSCTITSSSMAAAIPIA